MRLIDAEKALKDFKCAFQGPVRECIVKIATQILEMQKTVDAKPVVHANWEYVREFKENGKLFIVCSCSNCEEREIRKDGATIKFCPNCGAKMDGE